MALWREGGFAADEWTVIADDADLPASGRHIVSLKRWRREAEVLRGRELGVQLDAGKDAQAALAEVADRPLVALKFDKFGDGRAYSYAILLRQRHGFRGDLRAVGDVLLDEILLMLRCGFTSFGVTAEPTLRALRERGAPKFPVAYQPGLAPGETRVPARGWGWRLPEGTVSAH
jgi:phosphoadenosine phosphosulfate reductase